MAFQHKPPCHLILKVHLSLNFLLLSVVFYLSKVDDLPMTRTFHIGIRKECQVDAVSIIRRSILFYEQLPYFQTCF